MGGVARIDDGRCDIRASRHVLTLLDCVECSSEPVRRIYIV